MEAQCHGSMGLLECDGTQGVGGDDRLHLPGVQARPCERMCAIRGLAKLLQGGIS